MIHAGAFATAALLLANLAIAASTSGSHSKSANPNCINNCHRQWTSDGGQCVNRDPACLAEARAKYDACVLACVKPPHTTTTTRPRPTTTTTTTLSTTTTTLGDPTTTSTTTTPNRPSITTTTLSHATTTTTLKRSTTTTTLVVAFSQATAACIKQATADKKVCLSSASAAECQAEFDTSFANCFAPGKGVTCAAACVAKKAKCTNSSGASSANRSACVNDCHRQWINAGGQCGGANQPCLAAARAAYDSCVAGCTNPATVDCRTAFSACLTKCLNL